MRAIMELKAIGVINGPHVEKMIEEWIGRNIVELSVEAAINPAFKEKHSNYEIDVARKNLGAEIAKYFNPYPKWTKDENAPYLRCKLSSLVLKNDFGIVKL